MDTGPRLHREPSCNVDLGLSLSPPPPPSLDPPNIVRRKIRKKSIRNTKDSAEMARLRYHRDKTETQQSHSLPGVDRHFSVANVGSNGTMYLRYERPRPDTALDDTLMLPRPVARPYPRAFRPYPRAFRPPPTPPDSSDPQQRSSQAFYWHDGLHQSAAQLSTRLPEQQSMIPRRRSSFDSGCSQKSKHETHGVARLRSPSLDSIPRQARLQSRLSPPSDAVDSLFAPLLEVPIPNFRLGSPRFSDRGTAFLHNSYHTAFSSTTDLQQPPSIDHLDRLMPPPSQGHQNSIDLRRSPSVSWFSPSTSPAVESHRGRPFPSPLAAPPLELDRDEIPHTIYDKVAADSDNSQYVRYADGTHDIVAATPTRLVAEITSVKFLDYDLLSDFFLTYRAFLSPSDLARYLVARLRWAVSQHHESGRVVRVRTFVALRHWILNYFTQDFEPDHELRTLFCNLVNKLALHLAQRPQGGAGDIQVLTELQKCWNRTCALVWGPTAAPQAYMPLGVDVENDSLLPGMTNMRSITNESHMRSSSYMANNISAAALTRPDTRSRLSEASIQVTSCSFPRLKRSKHNLKNNSDKEKPGLLSPPKSRGFHRHKRSDSFSDALRDSRIDRPASSQPTTEIQVRPGRIIRGLVIHPSTANVVGPGPPSPPFPLRPEDTRPSMSEALLRPPQSPAQHARLNIFGSMRRALSTRNPTKSPFHHRPKTVSSSDVRKIGVVEPQPRDMIRQIQARKAQNVHTDALAAMVMRSWEQQGNEVMHELAELVPGTKLPLTRSRSKTIDTDLPTRPGATRLLSNVTTSSRSIMIIDDTGIDESERTPDLEHTIVAIEQSRADDGLSRQSTREHNQAAIQDAAMNNTAFLMPYDMVNFDQTTWTAPTKSATLSTAPTTLSIMSSPHSPPPNVPLPPLPNVAPSSTRPMVSMIGAKPSPDTEITTSSFGTGQLYSPISIDGSPALSFRKSSLVDPTDLPGPARQLRRKPGGNLRGVDTVHDLGITHRRQSTGSVTSPISIYGSPVLTVTSGDPDVAQMDARLSRHSLRPQASDGDIFDAARRVSLRLLSTHSSLRRLRPSMEIEVARLREMPHVEDDGGVESALLKLEGRYIPSRSSDKTVKSFDFSHDDKDFPSLTRQQGNGQEGHIQDENSPSQADAQSPFSGGETGRFVHKRHGAMDVAMTFNPIEPTSPGDFVNVSAIATKDFAESRYGQDTDRPVTPVQAENEQPDLQNTPASTFLLDDGESLVDRSSMHARQQDPKPSTDAARSFLFDAEDEEAVVGCVDHFQPPPGHHPLTPPTTADNMSDHGFDQFNAQLLLPGPPTVKPRKSFRLSELLLSDQLAKKAEQHALPRTRNLPTQHTPFILAHSSESLAMQFTIIEKDALDSVDWKDLINLNWSQKVPSVRDWAQYIHAFPTTVTEVSSIDLIITRFNLVIKWCISSVLLCATSEERAQCITKFVHIATHSHQSLRNFATTAQITIALLSSDLSRLSTTWSKVAQAEKDALQNLETLVSPMRNFAALRTEMESAAASLSDDDISAGKGVIPFLGVYTRDLALNAQKPAFMSPVGRSSSDQTHEKLVNFERHRTTASIVKGVLRLLDASSRYVIKSDTDVLAKCLWLAALADNEICELSKGLEK